MNRQFLEQMQSLLKDEYNDYLDEMKKEPNRGYRINLLKADIEDFFACTDLSNEPTGFCSNGYRLRKDDTSLGRSIPYAAGLFYIQEPSASAAVTIMDPRPGMKILDLCAAPGSKSTEILEKLNNSGILVANEINRSRSEVLCENVERCGAANAVILNDTPAHIADQFASYFDMVLCDAPCSGEGMFRKNPDAEKEWSIENVCSCAKRQKEILEDAYRCLKPGGVLVYSTCTLNTVENEDVINAFISEHSDMHTQDAHASFGRGAYNRHNESLYAVRIMPMDHGEGHFICRMIKEDNGETCYLSAKKSEKIPEFVLSFLDSQLSKRYPYLYMNHDKVYGGTYPFIETGRCMLVRQQVYLGRIQKDRFEPSHAMYMSSYCSFRNTVNLSDEQAMSFLMGNALIYPSERGYCSMQWKGFPIGFGKSDGKTIKNHYPKKLRISERNRNGTGTV